MRRKRPSKTDSQRLSLSTPNNDSPPQVIMNDQNEGKIVVYSKQNKSVVVCDYREPPLRRPESILKTNRKCPLCQHEFGGGDHSRRNSIRFMHPEYFSALEDMHAEEPLPNSPEPEAAHFSSSFITGYYQKFFIEVKKLGTGSFGSVFLCKHILNNVDLGTYAVKKIVLSDDPDWQKRVFREVRLLERVHHPNIIAYRHTWLENAKIADFGPTCPCLFLLMEYANAGNLDDYLAIAEKKPLNEDDIWQIFIELLSGLRHLHHAGIIHRDIKPANILLSRDFDAFSGVEYTRVLLSDFGQCESMLRNQQLPRTGFTGTMLYAAPELLKKDGDYDHSCDIYSLGILIYALAYGSAPYQDMMDASQEELYAKIMHDKRVSIPDFPRRSRDLVDLIHFLTHPDRFKRPSVDDIMNDPRFIMRISRQKFSSSSAHSGIPDILDESRNPTQTLLPSPKFSAPLLALPIAQNTRNEKQSVIPSTRAHSDSEIPEEKIIAALEPIEHKNLERPSKRQKSNLDFRSTIFIFFAILKLWAIEKSCNGNPSNEVERYGSIIFALVPLIIGRTNIMGYSSDFHLVTLGFMWSLLCQYMKFSCTPESLSNSHFIILLLQLIALLILKNFRS